MYQKNIENHDSLTCQLEFTHKQYPQVEGGGLQVEENWKKLLEETGVQNCKK